MTNGFFAAARATLSAFGSRRGNEATDPARVSPAHATIAFVLMLVVLVGTQMLPIAAVAPELLEQMAAPLVISIAVQMVPFVVIAACAIWSKQRQRLPMLVMLTALGMAVIHVTSYLISLAGVRSDAALVGVMAYMVGRASWTMLGFSIAGAIVTGLVVAVGIVAASLLLFALPGAQSAFGGAGIG